MHTYELVLIGTRIGHDTPVTVARRVQASNATAALMLVHDDDMMPADWDGVTVIVNPCRVV